MRVTGPRGLDLPRVEVATFVLRRWRGLMRWGPRPLLLPTSMVHGFWLREALWLVGLDRSGSVREVRLLRRRHLAWLRGCRWVLELPPGSELPRRGDRLVFEPGDGEADRHGRTPLPVRHTDRQPG